jgi:hypothetical protein
LARYAHQPISELRGLSLPDLAMFTEEVSALIQRQEESAVDFDEE